MSGRVAPHEANEVRLVLAGVKPLASIEKAKQPIMYSLAIALAKATGQLYYECIKSADSPNGELVLVHRRNKPLVKVWKDLQATGVKDFGIKEYHRRMGRLYGYREEDIEAFISAEINCNCSKCRGG